MRPFSISKPAWWVGPTGQAITALAIEAKTDEDYTKALELRTLGSWLQNCSLHNQYGLYHAPEGFVTVETGLRAARLPGLWKALNLLEFCTYDRQTGWVWVYEMAGHQLKLPLNGQDNQIKAASHWYRTMPDNPFLGPFWDRYRAELRLSVPRREGRARQAPSKGLVPGPVQDLDLDPDHARAPAPAPTAGGRGHRGHVFCGQRLCLPRFLFDEFKGQLGPTWTEGQIETWAAAIDKAFVEEARPIVDDPLVVWRREWRAAMEDFARRPRATHTWRDRCPHGGSCGTMRQCADLSSRDGSVSFSAALEQLEA